MRLTCATLLLTAGSLAITACGKETAAYRGFYSEAGSGLKSDDFGESTVNNTLVQSGDRSMAINLTRRFASEVPNTVNFAFDSAVLDGDAQAALRKQADWILQFPEIRFRVYGHTDLVGSQAYNYQLGLRRAQAVVNYLVSMGVSRSRLEALVSFGKTRPLVDVQTEDRRNRRTVTEVSGFVTRNPTLLNGKYAQVIWRDYVEGAGRVAQQQEQGGTGETGAAE
jgi:outer membrane protein OmpA-like peptidoglycan-associated protein